LGQAQPLEARLFFFELKFNFFSFFVYQRVANNDGVS
jgi:hypothetical protein